MERLLTLYSEVQSTDVRWLWYPFIAIGKITLLQGDPGDGKSTMMMNLIAELSTGGKTPDGCKIGAPQKVIYQCSEDGVSDTIKPRLERCGADCRKIAFINEEVYNGLTLDDERIRQAIIEFRPRLVVIDPIQAYLGSDSDLQIAGRARKLMRRLGMWAAGYDCAIVLIGHLNKKEGSKGLYRSLGSIDVVAAARSVLQVERDTENPDISPEHAGAAQHRRRADPVDRPRQRLCGHLPAVPPEREPVLPAGGVHPHGRLPEAGLFRQSADAAHRPVHRLFRSVLLHELPPAHPLACVPAVRGGPAGIPAADGRAAAGTPADAD